MNPDIKRIEQTFPVKLFENTKGPLQVPAVLTDIVKRFNDEGKKLKQSESSYTPIFSEYESNISDDCYRWIGLYMHNYHIIYYGETNEITVIGNKSRVGELNTAHKGPTFHRDAKGNKCALFSGEEHTK